MNAAIERMLENLLIKQEEILHLLRFMAYRTARRIIEENLTKSIERRVYELSDGIRSSRDIEKAVAKEVTQRTVVTWWQKWRRLGVVEQSPRYSGRMQRLISLEELGLAIDPEEDPRVE